MIDRVNNLGKKFYNLLSDDVRMQEFLDDDAFDGIWFWDLNHPNILWVSKSLKKLLGYDLDYQFKPQGSWENLVPSQEIDSICSAFDKYLVSNATDSFKIDIPFFQKNKNTVNLHCKAIAVNDKSYLLGIVHVQAKLKHLRTDEISLFPFVKKDQGKGDYTSGNLSHELYSLQSATSRYESLIVAGGLGGWEYKVSTRDLWCSKEYFELLGYDTSMIRSWEKYDVQKVWIDLLHPDDVENAREYFGQYLKKLDGVYHQNFRMKHANGSWVWVSSKGRAMYELINGEEVAIIIGTHSDISESKRLETELYKSNQLVKKDNALLKSIINSPQDIFIVSIDNEYRFTSFSPSYQNFVKEKFNKDIYLGYKVIDLFNESQMAVFKPAIDSALRGDNCQISVAIPVESGSITYVENRYNSIKDSSGNVIGATVFIHDITKEKNYEISNKINELRYASLFTSANDAIFIANVNTGIIVDANLKACELMGFERSELIGIHQSKLHPNSSSVLATQKFKEFTTSKDYNSIETFIQTKNGEKIPVLISSATPFKIGSETFSAAYFKNLSKTKEAESNTTNLLELLKIAEMISTTGSVEFDLLHNRIIWSDEFFKILGYEPQSFELDNNTLYNHIYSEDTDEFVFWQEKAMQTIGQSDSIDLRILKNDGTISTIRTSGISFADANGKIIKFIAVAKDITMRNRISQELNKQNKQLKEIAWTQSHLVRGPLTKIMGLVSAIQKDIVPETEKSTFLKYIQDSANELDEVIKEITYKTISK